MLSKQQINSLANAISKKFNTEKIFLFGSYAHGKPGYESDLDLCIVTDLKRKRKIDIVRDIRREIILDYNTPIDILIYDNKEFNERASLQNTIEYKISKHGILING